ncbi:helix-turn-helix domain-containing protein [Nonomuraea sp. NPDC001023]|uniref:helix-turn-helix domain-containing protein n=1 Tax=unclassified Nonomuraea TaxID=2593643 RepID=UPI00331B0387
MTKLLITPAEAAAVLGIGRTKIYELMAAGLLPSVKIGRARRVPFAALTAFVAAITEEHAA